MTSPGPKLLSDTELAAAKNLLLPLLPDYQKTPVSTALDRTRRIYDAYMTLSSGDRGTTSSVQNGQRLRRITLTTSLGVMSIWDLSIGTFPPT